MTVLYFAEKSSSQRHIKNTINTFFLSLKYNQYFVYELFKNNTPIYFIGKFLDKSFKLPLLFSIRIFIKE